MADRDYRDVVAEAREAIAEGDDVAVRRDMAGEPGVAGDGVADAEAREGEMPQSGLVETIKRLFGGDRVLWIIIWALMIISVLVVYSSTAKMAYMPSSNSSTSEFLHSQLWLLAICIVAMFVTHRFNSDVYRRVTYWVFAGAFGLTLAVYFVGTASINGAARWINILGFQFQPSEMLKLAIIMYLSRALADRQTKINSLQIVPSLKFWTWNTPKQLRIWRQGGIPIFLPIVLSCMVIMPAHTSSAVLVFIISLMLLYIGRVNGREIRRILLWAVVGAALVGMMGLGRSHTAGGRISTWIDVWTQDRTKVEVQDLSDTERSMIAIYNGGIMGRGAGQSSVRVEMTHPEGDYAFAFFVEEYGLVISMILIALYVWIFFRASEIFKHCPKKFPALLTLGIALLITMQGLLHIMVAVNILPETGQPLPLISRGGSSLLFTSIGLGMILSVSRQNIENSHTDEN